MGRYRYLTDYLHQPLFPCFFSFLFSCQQREQPPVTRVLL
jgi:hypothetical protein